MGVGSPQLERWPELAKTRFFLAIGDGAAANVGSGGMDSSRLCATVGTSAAVRCVVHAKKPPRVPPGLWSYRITRDQHLVGGALTDAGSLYIWLSSVLAGGGTQELWSACEALAPDSHGLIVLPFLSGERAPGERAPAPSVLRAP